MLRRPLALTIDLDEWYHCRWATGSGDALWPSTTALFRDVYRSDRPVGELIEPTEWLLARLAERGAKATFFVLGEVARWYPDLIRRIADGGHEIACHGMHHVNMTWETESYFASQLAQAKSLLEELTGRPVRGFRAPNFVVAPYLGRVLRKLAFSYDSSICPAWSVLRTGRRCAHAPREPYEPDIANLSTSGRSGLIELPIAMQAGVALPGGTGIMARVAGTWWARTALNYRLSRGSAMFYCHPYELTPAGESRWPAKLPLRARVFLRRTGDYLRRFLLELMDRRDVTHVTAGELAELARNANAVSRARRGERGESVDVNAGPAAQSLST